jgi:hypothetical protein
MALISRFIKQDASNSRIQSQVEAGYNDFIFSGERYARIQTFGSDNRKITGKQSQNIQLNKESAKQLIQLLNKTFDL